VHTSAKASLTIVANDSPTVCRGPVT